MVVRTESLPGVSLVGMRRNVSVESTKVKPPLRRTMMYVEPEGAIWCRCQTDNPNGSRQGAVDRASVQPHGR
jgi:hypothetical protein